MFDHCTHAWPSSVSRQLEAPVLTREYTLWLSCTYLYVHAYHCKLYHSPTFIVNMTFRQDLIRRIRHWFALAKSNNPLRALLYLWMFVKGRLTGRQGMPGVTDKPEAKSFASYLKLSRRQSSFHAKDDNNVDICASRVPRGMEPRIDHESSRPNSFMMSELPGDGMLHPGPYLSPHISTHDLAAASMESLAEDIEIQVDPGSPSSSHPHGSSLGRASPIFSLHSPSTVSLRNLQGANGVRSSTSRSPSRERRYSNCSSTQVCMHASVATPSGIIPTHIPHEAAPSSERIIYPILKITRYNKGVHVPQVQTPEYILKPVTTDFSHNNIPPLWTSHVHPEGILYFRHKTERIYTDANLCDPEILQQVETFESQLRQYAHAEGIQLDKDVDLVLDLQQTAHDPAEYYWCYYFVNHAKRSLFWIHKYDIGPDLDVSGAVEPAHIKHKIEYAYWLHCEMFPHSVNVSMPVIQELASILQSSLADKITSPSSTVDISSDDLGRMITTVETMRVFESNSFTTFSVGRYMSWFANLRFMHFHGLTAARLSWEQSVYGKTSSRTSFISTMSPLLFNAPDVHLRELDRVWVDKVISAEPWNIYVKKLTSEWQEFILLSTVLLNANVAFLAIPSVDVGDQSRTAAQIASYVSMVTSVGSIILGLLLVRHHRSKPRETAGNAAQYLWSFGDSSHGLEVLAILYSLPYALLMWGMVTFLAAFSFECFLVKQQVSLYLVGTAWGLVALLIIWSIYTAWETSYTWSTLHEYLIQAVSNVKMKMEEKPIIERLCSRFKSLMSAQNTRSTDPV